MQLTMTGRTALITGGSLGIGRAIAARFLEAGAGVALVARRREVLEEARAALLSAGHAGPLIAVAADISSIEGCSRAFGEAERQLGKIDVVVNNAGQSMRGNFLEVTDEMWSDDIDLKLMAAVRLARFAMPGMIQRRWGRIINILNTGAKAPPAAGAPTAVTRAAGLALTKVLAGEGAKHNVLVNALLVGRIESDQWVRRAEAEGKSLADYYADMGRMVPMGRVGTSEEFANAACFLASDAGSYITGTAINVDGGLCPVV